MGGLGNPALSVREPRASPAVEHVAAVQQQLVSQHRAGAELARILERTWDKSEDYGGDTALSKTNRALFDSIDKAMDQFVNLLMDHITTAPDPAKVKAAYTAYLEKLKQAD